MRPTRRARRAGGTDGRRRLRSRHAWGALALSAVTGVVLALGATPDVGASTTTTSPTTTTDTAARAQQTGLLASVNSALSAATAQRSVHYVQSASAGKQRVTIVADASSSQGRQVVTVHNGSSVGHITGELTGDKVYFRGDAYGLSSYLGMPTNLASKYKNRWIVFTKSSQGFAQSVKAFTIQGPLSVVKLTKGTLSAAGATTVDGQAVTAIAGRTTALSTGGKSGTATLYLASSGPPLPVRFVGTGTQSAGSAKGEVDFSLWGERVVVPAPSHAIAASQVQ